MFIRIVVLICAFAALTLVAAELMAQTYTFTWQPPTERVNGQSLDPETEIENYALYCGSDGTVSGERYLIDGFVAEGSHRVSASDLLPAPGEYQCALTSIDTKGNESTQSNIVTVEWLSDPKAPSGLSVTAN